MVDIEHILADKGLDVKKLRLIIGTSMGCMHAVIWGEKYPEAIEALQPMERAPSASLAAKGFPARPR